MPSLYTDLMSPFLMTSPKKSEERDWKKRPSSKTNRKRTWHGFNDQTPVVQGFDCLLHATEGLRQTDVHLHDQVYAVPLEHRMLFLIEDNNDVSRLKSWLLIALAGKGYLLTVFHALVHCDFQDLALTRDLATVALLTSEEKKNKDLTIKNPVQDNFS